MNNNTYCIIVTSFSNEETGEKIINSLMEKRLAACIQVQDIKSYYHWKGKVNHEKEKSLFIKTKKSLYHEIEKEITRLHDYETPEIIEIPINSGLPDYLNWIEQECK